MVKIYLSKCIFLSETGDCLDGAIVTDGGNIAFVGDRQEALQEFPEGKVIDLGNRTVTAGPTSMPAADSNSLYLCASIRPKRKM